MSSDTLVTVPAAPGIPELAENPGAVPRRPRIHHRTYPAVPPLRYTVVTSVLGIGRHYVEKHYARGTGTDR